MLQDLESERSEAVALMVREELARRRLSRQWLADEARVSLSTLEKALSGRRPFTLSTVVRLEEALGLSLRGAKRDGGQNGSGGGNGGLAPDALGAYTRAGVGWLEGEYVTIRPSFRETGALYAYRTRIAWEEDKGHLVFSETGRIDQEFEQQGVVSFPHLSGHIYLVTAVGGQYRLAILNRPSSGGTLNGVLTTLVSGAGAQLIPASTPIALVPSRPGAEAEYGVIHPGSTCYERYRACIEKIPEQGYALFPR
jgi:hypothetical protein